jgi:hypothetical protein
LPPANPGRFTSSADLQRIPHLVAAEIIEQLTGASDPADATSDHPN